MGMMHGGMLARLAADWLGLGQIRGYRVRFEERVWPGDTLSFTGRVNSVHSHDGVERVEVELACHNQNGERALSGSAIAEYPL